MSCAAAVELRILLSLLQKRNGKVLKLSAPLCCLQGVPHQHCHSQQSDTAGYGCALRRNAVSFRRMNIAHQGVASLLNGLDSLVSFAGEQRACLINIVQLINADVNHGRARLDVIAAYETGAPDCGH